MKLLPQTFINLLAFFVVVGIWTSCSETSPNQQSDTKNTEEEKSPTATQQSTDDQTKSVDYDKWAREKKEQPMLGEPAPELQLPSLSGRTYSLSQFKGKYIVLTFFATWCPYSNDVAPYLEPLYQKYKDKGVQLVAINVKEPESLVKRFAKKHSFSFPILLDENGEVATRYTPTGVMPDIEKRHQVVVASHLIIGPQGKIRFFELLDTENFDEQLTELKERLNQLMTKS
jgi:peroxiredoxin